MKRIFFKACLLSAAMFITAVTFGQQGVNSGNQPSPANSGTNQAKQNQKGINQPGQNQQGQAMPNPSDSSGMQGGQGKQNEQYTPTLQPGESYPTDQNIEINKKNLTDSLGGQHGNQVTPGVQNQGNPAQSLPSGQGNQAVPGDSSTRRQTPVNPGINNNNPAVPNDQGTQNPAVLQRDKTKQSSSNKGLSSGQGSQALPGDTSMGSQTPVNPGVKKNKPTLPKDQGAKNPAKVSKDKP